MNTQIINSSTPEHKSDTTSSTALSIDTPLRNYSKIHDDDESTSSSNILVNIFNNTKSKPAITSAFFQRKSNIIRNFNDIAKHILGDMIDAPKGEAKKTLDIMLRDSERLDI